MAVFTKVARYEVIRCSGRLERILIEKCYSLAAKKNAEVVEVGDVIAALISLSDDPLAFRNALLPDDNEIEHVGRQAG